MLIKKRKLVSVNGGRSTERILQPEHAEVNKALQLEIQKAKQEAKQIKSEAQSILTESEQKLKQAESKVKEIISRANIEAKNIKEKVYKETLQVANQEAEAIKEKAKIVLKELFEVKRETLTQANKEIIKVALDLAEKIIRYQVTVDPNILQTQVVEAIKKATSEADRVQVFVNPSDLKALEESIPQMDKLFPAGVDIIPLANDSVDPGSCIIETKSGQLDARFSTQLQALTGLINHIEVIEPVVEINEEIPSPLPDIQETSFAEIKQEAVIPVVEDGEELTEPEKEILESELLRENTFPFVSNEPTVSSAVPLELEDEEEKMPQIELEAPVQPKKRLGLNPIPERTREEAEELDEGIVFEYEDEEQEEKKEVKLQNILKPKKSASEVSDIASELEENPEWKDIVEEEGE